MKSKGYTLIEILIALTVITILFSVGFVAYRDFSRRQAIAGAAKIVQGNLRKIQQQALSGQKPSHVYCNDPQTLVGYNFLVDSSGLGYKIQADCSGGAATTEEISLPSGISMSIPTSNPILFKVLGLGTNIPDGGSIVLTLTQDTTNNISTITIGSGGDIK